MNPLLLDFPDSFDTERLTIRAPRVEDAQEVMEAVIESLPELRPWMPWAAEPPVLEGTVGRLRHAMAKWITREDLLLHIYLKAFQEGRLGYAAALAWVLTIISAIVVIIVYRTSERYVYYEEGGEEKAR